MLQPRSVPLSLFEAAIGVADPARCVPPNLPEPPEGCTIVTGAGKSVPSMARVVEERWTGDLTGLVVIRYGHAVHTSRIQVREAAHLVRDAARFHRA
jgi:hydroxypyruvate reductase